MPQEQKSTKHRKLPLEVYLIGGLAIVCITVLEVVAMWKGIDGAAFGIVIAAIAGLAGGLAGFKLTNFLK